MSEPKDIDAADWVDEDLLTRSEAGERLVEEIESERKKLADLQKSESSPEVIARVRRRLDAMERLVKAL
ncbi:hypothetical protein [Gordonia humi]|uniref:Uncharacterized protein n=1 Tax=Gordonia humi TaxID=686429 RepID=A0A840EU88_9ACTN|nr:hypothetical protein [Gordonia humi]MBB4135141.1 hypothetical protein [Gordonia humi]